jgi:hypothetical protein
MLELGFSAINFEKWFIYNCAADTRSLISSYPSITWVFYDYPFSNSLNLSRVLDTTTLTYLLPF